MVDYAIVDDLPHQPRLHYPKATWPLEFASDANLHVV